MESLRVFLPACGAVRYGVGFGIVNGRLKSESLRKRELLLKTLAAFLKLAVLASKLDKLPLQLDDFSIKLNVTDFFDEIGDFFGALENTHAAREHRLA